MLKAPSGLRENYGRISFSNEPLILSANGKVKSFTENFFMLCDQYQKYDVRWDTYWGILDTCEIPESLRVDYHKIPLPEGYEEEEVRSFSDSDQKLFIKKVVKKICRHLNLEYSDRVRKFTHKPFYWSYEETGKWAPLFERMKIAVKCIGQPQPVPGLIRMRLTF